MIKLVILDFDDTLCLTEEACFQSENKVAMEMGFAPMSREVHKSNWGKPLAAAIVERVPGVDIREFMERVEKVMEEYSKEGKQDPITKENLHALDTLRKAGKKIAILTSRSFPEVRHLLHEAHPLSNRVEAFYHKDNSEYVKPDPRVFTQSLSHFKVLPEETVYVGDSVSDAIAAKGAGLYFISVLESELSTKEDFKGQEVDFFAQKFTDILPYILQDNR
jgi:phosphoglycolate phosphatase